MKKWRISYSEEYAPSYLSYWVHKHLNHEIWSDATEFDPPLPKAIPCKGYPMLHVEMLAVSLHFASVPEVEHFLDVIRCKNMPTSRQLSALRGGRKGPNGHWLSRLPTKIKPWSKRERIIPVLEKALTEYRKVCVPSP